MPFQVIFSVYNEPPGIITFMSAGEDFTAICNPSVTLSAIIIGDLTGHTFLWEQISGSVVIWNTPLNQITVSYSPTLNDNKSFRFWVDKGTPVEKFSDINAFSTPTSKIKSPNLMGAPNNEVPILHEYDRSPKLKVLFNLSENEVSSANIGTVNDIALNWGVENTQWLSHFILYEKVLGVWTQISTFPKNVLGYFNPTIGSTYKISAVFINPYYNSQAVYDSNVITIPSTLYSITNTTVFGHASSKIHANVRTTKQTISSYTIDDFVLTTQMPVSTINVDQHINPLLITSYTVDDLTLTTIPPAISNIHANINQQNMYIISYSVSSGAGIGG